MHKCDKPIIVNIKKNSQTYKACASCDWTDAPKEEPNTMKKTIILKQDLIGFPKGEYQFNHVMADALVKKGKAEYKEEKKVIKTKEEKFEPETKAKPKRKRTKKK